MPLSFAINSVSPAQGLETIVGPATGPLCVLVGSNLYYVTFAEVGSTGTSVPPAYVGNLWVMKSTDGGFTWSRVGNVFHSTGFESTIALTVTGTTIRILVKDGATGQLVIWNWDTVTDALLANSALGPTNNSYSAPLSCVAYSGGTILCVYTDPGGDLQAVVYTPGSNSWGAPSPVFAASTSIALIKESSTDRSYCFFMLASGGALGCITITAPLTMGSVQVVDIPWSAFDVGEASRPGLPCINGADTEIIFPFLDPGDGTNLPGNVLNVARAPCADNPVFVFEVVNSSAALPAGQFLSSWVGEAVFTAAAISSAGVLYVFYAAVNTVTAQDPATVGTLYYQQNTGVGLGWGAAVQVQALVAPDAFAQFYPVTISPTTFGLFTAQLDPTNFFSAIGNLKYTSLTNSFLTTGAAPPLSITCGSPPAGTVGVAYSHTFPASGGTAPYTFAIIAGALPGGLSLNAVTGIVSGIPTVAGVFGFTIQVTDSTRPVSPASTASVACSITIAPAPVVLGSIRITLRGVKLRPICEPEDGGPVPEISKVPRAL